MAQLSDAMNINIDMDRELNIKATYNLEYRKLAEKAKGKSEFEKNLDIEG